MILKKGKRKLSRRKRILRIFSGVFLGIAVVSASLALREYMAVYKVSKQTDELKDMALTEDIEIPEVPEIKKFQGMDLQKIEYKDYEINEELDGPLFKKINFAKLRDKNGDVLTWIYFPKTHIDYPVMQEPEVTETDFFYLNHDINKEYAKMGSLFTPKIPEHEGETAYITIFGHHSDFGGLMFTELENYKNDSKYIDTHEYFYMYWPDRSERWRIWSGHNTKAGADVYKYPYLLNTPSYGEVLNTLSSENDFEGYAKPDINKKTILISTCDWGYIFQDGRYVLSAVPDAVYYYDKNMITDGDGNDLGRLKRDLPEKLQEKKDLDNINKDNPEDS